MKWLDYREKLGIGFNDNEKYHLFLVRVFNSLNLIRDTEDGVVDYPSYLDFCNMVGIEVDYRTFNSATTDRLFHYCVNFLDRHKASHNEFLSYYVAFMNSNRNKSGFLSKDLLQNILETELKYAQIPYELIQDDDGVFIFPKGVKEFDSALVSAPLQWLASYPCAEKAWSKALREYAENNTQNASDVADMFRKALETFFQEFFNCSKSLENFKADYGNYLKQNGIPKEIAGNFEALLQAYTKFINNYAKHHDKTGKNVLEYLMYQTGNTMRLLLTLKQEDNTAEADGG